MARQLASPMDLQHARQRQTQSLQTGLLSTTRETGPARRRWARPWLGKLRAMPHENVLWTLAALIELPAPARPHVSWCHSRAFTPRRRAKHRDDGLRQLRQASTSDQWAWRALGLGKKPFPFPFGHHFSGSPRISVTSVNENGPSGIQYVLVLYTAAGRLIWTDAPGTLQAEPRQLPIKCTCISPEAQIHPSSNKLKESGFLWPQARF